MGGLRVGGDGADEIKTPLCRTYVPVVRAYGTNTLGFLTSAVAGCVFCSPTVGTRLALVFRKPAVARQQPDRAGRAGKRRISGLLSEPLRWGTPGSFRRADGLRVMGTGGRWGTRLRFFATLPLSYSVEWGFEPQTRIVLLYESLEIFIDRAARHTRHHPLARDTHADSWSQRRHRSTKVVGSSRETFLNASRPQSNECRANLARPGPLSSIFHILCKKNHTCPKKRRAPVFGSFHPYLRLIPASR